jgi:organic hydroperoxide reductase OsmC/OhrA
MHPLPHRYRVRATGRAEGTVLVTTAEAPVLETHAPPEFDGPGGYWSPESLLTASIADCYILSFRAVARASKLEWESLSVAVEGVLDRLDGVTRFVRFTLEPRLAIRAAAQEALARGVIDKAKRACLVTNSLNAEFELLPSVSVLEAAPAP